MSKFYRDLKAGLEEIVAYQEGNIELRSTLIELPEPPAAYKAQDIKKIREAHRYSQGICAKVLNVSKKTVQSWESGQRVPSHAVLGVIEVIDLFGNLLNCRLRAYNYKFQQGFFKTFSLNCFFPINNYG